MPSTTTPSASAAGAAASACEACHRAKKSCDRKDRRIAEGIPFSNASSSCSRCRRLGIECVPRVSRQGQGPKKRKRNETPVPTSVEGRPLKVVPTGSPATDDTADLGTNNACASEDGHVLEALTNTNTGAASDTTIAGVAPKIHFGIRYLVHSWVSFALKRRSWSLLERACCLAKKCGIPMNSVFHQNRKHALDGVLYGGGDDGGGAPLSLRDLPESLRTTCGLRDDESVSRRYLMVREANRGRSRYLATPSFECDVCSRYEMEQTWALNDKPVVKLLLANEEGFAKFTKAIHYSMARYTHPNKPVEAVRINGVGLKTTVGVQETMDMVYAFEIVDLERSFYVCEFLPRSVVRSSMVPGDTTNSSASKPPPSKTTAELQTSSIGPVGSNAGNDGEHGKSEEEHAGIDPLHEMFDNLPPLDEDIVDEDFDAFLELIGGP